MINQRISSNVLDKSQMSQMVIMCMLLSTDHNIKVFGGMKYCIAIVKVYITVSENYGLSYRFKDGTVQRELPKTCCFIMGTITILVPDIVMKS